MSNLTSAQQSQLLQTIKARFEHHLERHPHTNWSDTEKKLLASPRKLWSLYQMEQTGGEPDVVRQVGHSDKIAFFDCSAESPAGRRSLCYDRAALNSRKTAKPKNSAMDLVSEMGIELLTEAQYRHLQQYGEFDRKTSSWIETPEAIRQLGGALFCDRRYDSVFVYHNGAESYYASRGFRAILLV